MKFGAAVHAQNHTFTKASWLKFWSGWLVTKSHTQQELDYVATLGRPTYNLRQTCLHNSCNKVQEPLDPRRNR